MGSLYTWVIVHITFYTRSTLKREESECTFFLCVFVCLCCYVLNLLCASVPMLKNNYLLLFSEFLHVFLSMFCVLMLVVVW